mmetsp:Transcript_24214/g.40100  ORF Transcript_24214/g.40100 Transcript_24214/m.40100 type:complete len:273 (-) Transcript_24214:877-1695(-)
MDLVTADGGVISNLPVKDLAKECDTLRAFATSSWGKFSTDKGGGDDDGDSVIRKMRFKLEEFPKCRVQEFVDVVLSKKEADMITSDSLVDCCQIAHYLMCPTVLAKIEQILMTSIDSANCLSLCQLADQLGLSALLELCLTHLMRTLDHLKDNDSEAWDALTPELRYKIISIKTAMESSLHSRSRLYFSSLDEYLAIFAERVQYYQERLANAKDDQQSSSNDEHGSTAWVYAQAKIAKQERRVRTLELALGEQRMMFSLRRVWYGTGTSILS